MDLVESLLQQRGLFMNELQKVFRALLVTVSLFLAPHAQAFTILCLGDSLTEGYGVKSEEAWPSLLEQELKQKYADIKVINAGISGATTASGPGRMKWHLKNIAKNPVDLMILALGANDALRGLSPDAAKKNLEDTIELAKKAKIAVLLADMKVPPNLGKDYTGKFEVIFAAAAKATHVPLMPFFLTDVAGNAKLNQPDGIHPNPAGHKVVKKNVMDALNKLKLLDSAKKK